MRATIITPTFNAAAFIEACVANVVAQGDVILEHIIADGGSTDGTVEIVRNLQTSYPHLKLLPGPDKGQSDAMNKATAIARGEVIGILNADDFYEPEAVREAVGWLAPLKQPALVCGDCRILDEHGETRLLNRPRWLSPEALLQNSWMFPIPANPSAYFYTKAVHEIVGGYDITDSHAMDCDFLLTCAERVRMIYVHRHWGNFRLMPGCKTFDDPTSAQRVTEIIARHRAKLSAMQRRKMKIMMRLQVIRRRVGDTLRRYGLRR